MKRICIIGTGRVGLVTGTCLAELGNNAICVDSDAQKIRDLAKGIMPFYEPGLEEMVRKNVDQGRLGFITSLEKGINSSEIIFICVGTPQKINGECDLSFIEAVAQEVAIAMDSYKIVVEKSTVPVKTGARVKQIIKLASGRDIDFDMVSNPEFLREGAAIYDFMKPDRIIIGVESQRAANAISELYKPLNAPILITNIETAELIKYASNSFLALKISYINAIANLCEKMGADVTKVAEGIGYDKRIGRVYLDAGAGYGGSCLPKDVSALTKIAEGAGYDFELLRAVQGINDFQKRQVVVKAQKALGDLNNKTIGVLGLSFKPDTDDIREAPSLDIIRLLQNEGAKIKAYDPVAMSEVKPLLPDVECCPGPYQVAEGSDALILITEWDEFKNLDLARIQRTLRQPVMIDGRNIYNPQTMAELGFKYQSVGR